MFAPYFWTGKHLAKVVIRLQLTILKIRRTEKETTFKKTNNPYYLSNSCEELEEVNFRKWCRTQVVWLIIQESLSVLKTVIEGAQGRGKKILGRQVSSVEDLLKFWVKEMSLIHRSFTSGNSFWIHANKDLLLQILQRSLCWSLLTLISRGTFCSVKKWEFTLFLPRSIRRIWSNNTENMITVTSVDSSA